MSDAVVAVACSGGRDSMALLHATAVCAAAQGCRVVALHVNHGLSASADDWTAHVAAQCLRWRRRGWPVAFVSERLDGSPSPGESVEAWAREARNRSLARLAESHGASLVLRAHHRRDQAETFLLQALRGAGVSGLSAMPAEVERGGITWARPWLSMPRETIEAYVRRHRISHVDDDSNLDHRFARNRLRHVVWPAFTEAFPQAEASLARAAQWSQEAAACLAEVAVLDLAAVAPEGRLLLGPWSALSRPRRSNALRAWLLRLGQPATANLVERLLDELLDARTNAAWAVGTGSLRRTRDSLRWEAGRSPVASMPRESRISIRRAGRIALPGWGGFLVVSRVREGGVPLAWLAAAELRERRGAEQFQAGSGRPPRSLKKQFQSAGIDASERTGPLVFSGGLLVFVPGLGIDARVVGVPGQPQVALDWEPATAT